MMYWIDWASVNIRAGKIERAWMDGKHQETFVESDMLWPNGLTIDYESSKLYWFVFGEIFFLKMTSR